MLFYPHPIEGFTIVYVYTPIHLSWVEGDVYNRFKNIFQQQNGLAYSTIPDPFADAAKGDEEGVQVSTSSFILFSSLALK